MRKRRPRGWSASEAKEESKAKERPTAAFLPGVGNASVVHIDGQVAGSNLSDARHKEHIRDLALGLDFVRALRPVSFTLMQGDGRTDMGFLAQEVEAFVGDGYSVLGIGADADRTLSLRHTDFFGPLVKAIQEQQAGMASRGVRIAELETRGSIQQAQIEEPRQVRMLLVARSTATQDH